MSGKTIRRVKLLIIIGMIVGTVIIVGINCYVRSFSQHYIVTNVEELPRKSTAIVLGARIYSGGRMSHILYDRVVTAIDLYKKGRVKYVFITGEKSIGYNEVKTMRQYMMSNGVAEHDIIEDDKGVTTLRSMERAADHFKIRDAVVITQQYHLYRSIFLARKMGINARGYPADRRRYEKIAWFTIRDYFATVKAFFDIRSEFSER